MDVESKYFIVRIHVLQNVGKMRYKMDTIRVIFYKENIAHLPYRIERHESLMKSIRSIT